MTEEKNGPKKKTTTEANFDLRANLLIENIKVFQ